MKTSRFLFPIALLSLSALAFSQSETQKSPPSDARQSFDKLKTLAGSWEGRVTTVPPEPAVEGKATQVTLRATSMGNALMHEMTMAGRPDDPITMLYLDDDRLRLTHYCDAGNRPRMTGKMSADGKKVEFEFLDVAGSTQYGHMHGAVFTFLDENHHTEDWTFMLAGDKSVQAHFDLQRKK